MICLKSSKSSEFAIVLTNNFKNSKNEKIKSYASGGI